MKKVKSILCLAFALCLSIALIGCSGGNETSNNNNNANNNQQQQQNNNEDQSNTGSTDKLSFVTLQYPPYEYEENGEVQGVVVNILDEVYDRMGRDFEVEVNPWGRSIDMIKNGEADAIFTCYKNPEREKFADFSKEVLMPQVVSLFALKDSSIEFDGDLSKLSDYKIGVVRDVSYGTKFDNAAKNDIINVEEAETGEANMQKLLNGRIDLLVSNKYGALDILKDIGEQDKVKELSPELQSVPSYMAFSKKRNLTDVRDKFDEIIAEMKSDGTYDEIVDNYFGN